MSRYTALSLIPLPRVSATAAVALGAQVLSAASGLKRDKGFPKELQKPLDILSEKAASLSAAVSGSVVAVSAPKSADVPALDKDLDNCWGGTDDRLLGLSRLPNEPKAAEAAALRGRLFPDGLKFLTLEYKVEWAESKARLDHIDAENLGPEIDRLAGKEFLPAIRKAHAAYGEAQGLSGSVAAPVTEQPILGTTRDDFLKALRRYVTKIVAFGDDDTAEGEAVMKALLWPIDEWLAAQSKRANGSAGKDAGVGAGKDTGGKDTTTGQDTTTSAGPNGVDATDGTDALGGEESAPKAASGSGIAPKAGAGAESPMRATAKTIPKASAKQATRLTGR